MALVLVEAQGAWQCHGGGLQGAWQCHGGGLQGAWQCHGGRLQGAWQCHGGVTSGPSCGVLSFMITIMLHSKSSLMSHIFTTIHVNPGCVPCHDWSGMRALHAWHLEPFVLAANMT
jgi:hypothetical protein